MAPQLRASRVTVAGGRTPDGGGHRAGGRDGREGHGLARPKGRTLAKVIGDDVPQGPHGQAVPFRLTQKALRNLKPGRYLIEIRVGATRQSLGLPTHKEVTIKRAKR